MPDLLSVDGVTVSFGGLTALSDVSFGVRDPEILGLIGPNGAGKTTAFNVVCGFVSPDSGTVRWDGEALGRRSPRDRVRRGMVRTTQSLGLFGHLTVRENVMVGADRLARTGTAAALFGLPRSAREERWLGERADEVLTELGIDDVAQRLPGTLPYPVRKRVALGRALVARPRLLLLDEPASGLSVDEVAELGELIRRLGQGTAVMLVEHHLDLVMSVCDRVVVLDFGQVIATGPPAQVRNDPAVLEAYLGKASAS